MFLIIASNLSVALTSTVWSDGIFCGIISCSRLEAVFSTGMAGIGTTVLDGLITFPPPLLLLE
jgi:hypothetical protein